MKFRTLFIGAAALGLTAVPVVNAQALPVSPTPALQDIAIDVTSGTGSEHHYTGTIDPCTGLFDATGTTAGSYEETVTGTLTDTTLDYESSYDPTVAPHASYGYTVDATRSGGTWEGTFTAPDVTEPRAITGTVAVTGEDVDCTPEGPWMIDITVDAGGGHALTGEIDPCTGEFTAEGPYEPAGEDSESADGTFIGDDLDFTSVYNGGYEGQAYTYTVDAVATGTDWIGSYTYTHGASNGSGSGLEGTVVVTEGAPVNCHAAECETMDGTPGTPGSDPETCTVVTSTTTTDAEQVGGPTADTNRRTTGKGKSQTQHWNEEHDTTVHTTTQQYEWDGDSFEPVGDPQTVETDGDSVIVNCTQNVTSNGGMPSPRICTYNP